MVLETHDGEFFECAMGWPSILAEYIRKLVPLFLSMTPATVQILPDSDLIIVRAKNVEIYLQPELLATRAVYSNLGPENEKRGFILAALSFLFAFEFEKPEQPNLCKIQLAEPIRSPESGVLLPDDALCRLTRAEPHAKQLMEMAEALDMFD
jgi:hypothetical protein